MSLLNGQFNIFEFGITCILLTLHLIVLIIYGKIIHSTYNANNNVYELNLLATTLGNDELSRTSSEVSNHFSCNYFPPFKLRHSQRNSDIGCFPSPGAPVQNANSATLPASHQNSLFRSASSESLRRIRTANIRGRSNSNISMMSLRYINEIALENHAPFNASFKVLKSSVMICFAFSFVWISDVLHLAMEHRHSDDKIDVPDIESEADNYFPTFCQIHAIMFLLMFIFNAFCYNF